MSSTVFERDVLYSRILPLSFEVVLVLFGQLSTCSCDEETGAGVCWCFLERLHICFIIITAAAPMTMPETKFSFAVKNISSPIFAVLLYNINGYCVGVAKSVRQKDTMSFGKCLLAKKGRQATRRTL